MIHNKKLQLLNPYIHVHPGIYIYFFGKWISTLIDFVLVLDNINYTLKIEFFLFY